MKREELEALQLTKEQIDTIMDLNGKDINGVKAKTDTVQAQLAKAAEAIAERDTQLNALKGSTGNIDDLKAQLEALQASNLEKDSNYAKQVKTIRLDAAIMQALSGKAHDEKLTAGLINRDNLIEQEDGTWIGLQEQIQNMEQTKGFLFKKAEKPSGTAGFKFGAETAPQGATGADAALNAAFGLE